MNIADFKFEFKEISRFLWECVIITPTNQRFGIITQFPQRPPNEMIFGAFVSQPKTFFYDLKMNEDVFVLSSEFTEKEKQYNEQLQKEKNETPKTDVEVNQDKTVK